MYQVMNTTKTTKAMMVGHIAPSWNLRFINYWVFADCGRLGSVESQSAVTCKRARRACSLAAGSLAIASAIADTPEGAYPLSAVVITAKKLAERMPDFLLSRQIVS